MKSVMAVARSLWIWIASGLLILGWALLLFSVWLLDRDPLRLRTGRWFRRLGRALAGVNPWRVRISGLENIAARQTYVIVSNHQSLTDIPVIAHLQIDTKWLAKAELFRFPVLGWMLRMAGDVPVERLDRTKSARALLRCARYLRQGCSVVFFPEGTRSRTREVLPFNEGPFQLAIREQTPILPLVVDGAGDVLPSKSWIFGPAQDIEMRVLPPVAVNGLTAKDAAGLRDGVRLSIVEALKRLRGA